MKRRCACGFFVSSKQEGQMCAQGSLATSARRVQARVYQWV